MRSSSLQSVLLFLCLISLSKAWDNDELEIFDLVEEVNGNFYEYLEVKPDAGTSEIKKAYRRLSLILHPDKNDAEDASIKFRWLAGIYEILKDTDRRAVYDRVLVEGLPDWRSPVFYYRRMRKIGLAEGLAYLFVIATIFQYFISWAAYWERKFTLKEVITYQMGKKSIKKTKKSMGKSDDEIKDMIEEQELKVLGPRPSFWDTLPFQTFNLTKYLIVSIPMLPFTLRDMYKDHNERRLEEERLDREEEEEYQRIKDEKRDRKERKKERKRVTQRYDERAGGDTSSSDAELKGQQKKEEVFKQPANALQMWTDVDLAKLAKLIKKYPVGTQERWERIADILQRLPSEVTKMAKKIKDNAYMVPVSQRASQGITGLESKKLITDDCMEVNYQEHEKEASQEDSEEDSDTASGDSKSDSEYDGGYSVATKDEFIPTEVKSKVKTKGGKQQLFSEEQPSEATGAVVIEEHWSLQQQKALEAALVQFPKGATERWERIANKVPVKTKDQCILRFKTLAEMVKKKKEEASNIATTTASVS